MIVYRGYNKDYSNYGVPPQQTYIWTTDDESHALMYARSYKNGGLVEFELDDNQLNMVTDYECYNLFGDEYDDNGGLIDADDELCQAIRDEGYNCAYLDNDGIDYFLILDKKIIKSVKDIPLEEVEDLITEEINQILTSAGVKELK